MVLRYTAVDGRYGWLGPVVLFGGFAAVGVLGLAALFADRARALEQVGPGGMFCIVLGGAAAVAMFGPLTTRMAVVGWRSVRGNWWLRLSSSGFEINDRMFGPRRYEWAEIDRFLLAANVIEGTLVPRVGLIRPCGRAWRNIPTTWSSTGCSRCIAAALRLTQPRIQGLPNFSCLPAVIL